MLLLLLLRLLLLVSILWLFIHLCVWPLSFLFVLGYFFFWFFHTRRLNFWFTKTITKSQSVRARVCVCVCLLCCAALHFTSLQSSCLILKHKKNILDLFSVFLWSVLSLSLLLGFVFHCRLSLLLSLLHDVLNASRVGHKLSRPSCWRVAFKKSAPKKVACIRKRFFMPQLEILVWKLQQREQALTFSLLLSLFLLLSFVLLAKRAEKQLWSLFA